MWAFRRGAGNLCLHIPLKPVTNPFPLAPFSLWYIHVDKTAHSLVRTARAQLSQYHVVQRTFPGLPEPTAIVNSDCPQH